MRKVIIILIACSLLLIAGCSRPSAIQTDETKAFQNDILSQYATIKQLTIDSGDTGLSFHFVMDGSDNELKAIFEETRQFFLSESVQTKIVKERYADKHATRNFPYPDVEIVFMLHDKDTADYKYTSSYYGSSTDPSIVDNYRTWYYFEGNKAGVKLEQNRVS
ncbi:hypothetical protein DFQ01_14127 [Paenibacillus cellulosilyticus]|uniref:Lipoprotein n=1 Tax=Paenibacillus cellulosilyticus TaxID=375489 RepID=A0A2V2YF74_9BACL|nr:hypothetical protein [Paenibacillus cellulosilyticus]PWV90614.1 hypothetical protein DFQ01_14127 [Paenibacillus cellulosilyticus]QKS45222.1 hypothetical protein HUB94_12960 [Paenibacillus cellulosilyticus]